MKELYFTQSTQVHDLQTKAKQLRKWMAGKEERVKIGVKMHGRQITHLPLSRATMDRFVSLIDDVCTVTEPILSGKLLYAVATRKKK